MPKKKKKINKLKQGCFFCRGEKTNHKLCQTCAETLAVDVKKQLVKAKQEKKALDTDIWLLERKKTDLKDEIKKYETEREEKYVEFIVDLQNKTLWEKDFNNSISDNIQNLHQFDFELQRERKNTWQKSLLTNGSFTIPDREVFLGIILRSGMSYLQSQAKGIEIIKRKSIICQCGSSCCSFPSCKRLASLRIKYISSGGKWYSISICYVCLITSMKIYVVNLQRDLEKSIQYTLSIEKPKKVKIIKKAIL